MRLRDELAMIWAVCLGLASFFGLIRLLLLEVYR